MLLASALLSSRLPPTDLPIVYPEELLPGDVLASNRRSLMSSMIQGVTGGWCSHLALFVGHGEIVEAEYQINEVVRRSWIPAMLGEQRRGVAFRVRGLEPQQRSAVATQALARVGKPYDYVGAGMAGTRDNLPRLVPAGDAEDSSSFFCSELVFSSYRAAGIPLSPIGDSILSPAEFVRLAWASSKFAIMGRFGT